MLCPKFRTSDQQTRRGVIVAGCCSILAVNVALRLLLIDIMTVIVPTVACTDNSPQPVAATVASRGNSQRDGRSESCGDDSPVYSLCEG